MSEPIQVRTNVETLEETATCLACGESVPPHTKHECVRLMNLVQTTPRFRFRLEWTDEE